jgi:hypothetical protein
LQILAKKHREILSKVFLLTKKKIQLKARRFEDIVAIQTEQQVVLDNVMKGSSQRCFKQWERQWARCITSSGVYF